MTFCTQPHRFYCGVDRHARTMYLQVLDADIGAARRSFWGAETLIEPDARARVQRPRSRRSRPGRDGPTVNAPLSHFGRGAGGEGAPPPGGRHEREPSRRTPKDRSGHPLPRDTLWMDSMIHSRRRTVG